MQLTLKILIAAISLLPMSALAQTTPISGSVVDNRGEGIPGANILLKDTYDGTSSDEQGQFQFATEESGEKTLVVSFLGFETYEQNMVLDGTPVVLKIKLRESVTKLQEVVISAGAFEASDAKKGVVLRPLDIVTTAGAQGDIAGALNTLPGTTVVGEQGQLFVRGGAGYETQTFIDGMIVQNFFTSNVPDVPARGRFSPFQFKGTVFASGGYSAEYGQALSAALILNTQDISPQTNIGVFLSVLGGGGSYTKAWEKGSASVEANYLNLGPYLAVVQQNVGFVTAPTGYTGQTGFRWRTSETGLLKASGSFNHNLTHIEYPGGAGFYGTQKVRLENDFAFGNLSWSEALGERWTVFAGGTYSWNRDDFQADTFGVNTRNQFGQAKLNFGYRVSDRLRIKFGSDYQRRGQDQDFAADNGLARATTVTDNLAAAYAESDFFLGSRIVGRAGVRSEYSTVLGRASLAPRLSMAVKVGDGAQVSLAYGRFYQTPEPTLTRFNSNLRFEGASHYILNYQLMIRDRIFRAEAYYKTYDHLVKYDNPFLGNTFDNNGKGYARGVELFFRDRRSIRNADYWISYSFLDTERDFQDYPGLARPTFAAMHSLSVVYKHFIPKITTSISATYAFNSGRPYNDPNEAAFNAQTTPMLHNLSLSASYLTSIFNNFTVIFASVTNVLGFEQVFTYRYSSQPDANGVYTRQNVGPQAPRFFFVGLFMSITGEKFKREQLKRQDRVD